ncbi:MAG: LytR C-terminal domain-containing protein [Acidimicrobiia bacterium]
MNSRRPESNRAAAGGQSGLGILLLLAGAAVGLLILAYAFDDNDTTTVSTPGATTTISSAITTNPGVTTTVPGQTTVPGVPATTLAPGSIKVQVVNAAGVNGAAKTVSDALKGPGFTVLDPATKPAAAAPAAKTVIYYRGEQFKEPAERISKIVLPNPTAEKSIEIKAMTTPDPASDHDLSQANVVVYLGRDVAAK